MNDLIKLSSQEQFLQDSGFSMTLKEVADGSIINAPKTKAGDLISNKELVKKFNKMIAELDEDRLGAVNFYPAKYTDSQGKLRPTVSTDLLTMTWFIASYDHKLRLDIVNYAFDKLQKDNKKKLEEAVIEAKKPAMLSNGMCSVRRCIIEAWRDEEEAPNESDCWSALIWKQFAKTHAKATIVRVIPEELNGHVGIMKQAGNVKYLPTTIRAVWEEYVEAGKPVKS